MVAITSQQSYIKEVDESVDKDFETEELIWIYFFDLKALY
jgi:hypothetical protein